MQFHKFIYCLSYDDTECDLSKLESKYVLDSDGKDKLIFTDKEIVPSSSAFIKSRIDVISSSVVYSKLIDDIKNKGIYIEGFKVEYIVMNGDETEYSIRLQKLRDVGYSIEGKADYYTPKVIFALCCYEGVWYFGTLVKNDFDWHKHNQKPHSYSNSISINIAKALVNIAGKGKEENRLLDACCGVGTILLEACFAGKDIEGCDINWKLVRNTRENLSHFNYTAMVYRSDIKDISIRYDAVIIDLPYNLVSSATVDDMQHIITSAAAITDRLVIVSISDITNLIHKVGFMISDHCRISKKGKRKFARQIWVCEKKVSI